MHFIFKVFDLNVSEYRIKEMSKIEEESIVCSLLNIKQIFVNFKFEYGIFQKEIPLANSINIKCEVNKMKMEISTKSIMNTMKLIVKNYLN